MRILLVADHPSVAEQVRSAVLGLDDTTSVFQVATPQRALAVLLERRDDFDIVVGDNDTHPTGGLALARDVKAKVQMGHDMPPVVLLIARPQDRWLVNWSQADAYVQKPADPFDLVETLQAVAAGEPVPALPGIGGEPKPSLLDPAPSTELVGGTAEALADAAALAETAEAG